MQWTMVWHTFNILRNSIVVAFSPYITFRLPPGRETLSSATAVTRYRQSAGGWVHSVFGRDWPKKKVIKVLHFVGYKMHSYFSTKYWISFNSFKQMFSLLQITVYTTQILFNLVFCNVFFTISNPKLLSSLLEFSLLCEFAYMLELNNWVYIISTHEILRKDSLWTIVTWFHTTKIVI